MALFLIIIEKDVPEVLHAPQEHYFHLTTGVLVLHKHLCLHYSSFSKLVRANIIFLLRLDDTKHCMAGRPIKGPSF